MLKAITLYEPYASLMAIGAKRNETRRCRTTHRGDIAIHAAKANPGAPETIVPAVIDAFDKGAARLWDSEVKTLGCIIAVVDLWDVQPAEKFGTIQTGDRESIPITQEELLFGNYSAGRFIYRTHSLRRLAKPVPCAGFHCIDSILPLEVEALVRQQLGPRILNLECCSCGGLAPALKQWWNRDNGYGICPSCFVEWAACNGEENAIQCCGKSGIHHSLPDFMNTLKIHEIDPNQIKTGIANFTIEFRYGQQPLGALWDDPDAKCQRWMRLTEIVDGPARRTMWFEIYPYDIANNRPFRKWLTARHHALRWTGTQRELNQLHMMIAELCGSTPQVLPL